MGVHVGGDVQPGVTEHLSDGGQFAALQDQLGHADTHSRLIDEVTKYQADHGNFAKPPATAAVTSDDEPPTAPTKRRSSRTREPKQ